MSTPKKVHVAQVVRHGESIIIPEKLPMAEAINILQRQMMEEEKPTQLVEQVQAFPWDVALALEKAIQERYGYSLTGSFNTKREVASGYEQTTLVPWGNFPIPSLGPTIIAIQTTFDNKRRIIAQLVISTQGKYVDELHQLVERIRVLAKDSLYLGKAISVKFRDEDGEMLRVPEIDFLAPPSGVKPIFSLHLEHAISAYILNVIEKWGEVLKMDTPLKRAILLAGIYGTGKTLLARLIQEIAEKSGWGFHYIPEVSELAEAIQFARRYQPCVVFVEDVDRIAGPDRDDQVNDLLNTLDGISGKDDKIMLLMTTNHPELINEAMRRPGRIDLTLPVNPPDEEAVQRLIRMYAGKRLSKETNLEKAGKVLNGQIPAIIREVVERSKMNALDRVGTADFLIVEEDVCDAAVVMLEERKLFTPEKAPKPALDRIADSLQVFSNMAQVLKEEKLSLLGR